MSYYIEQHKFFDDRLTIFKKSVSKNWYARIFIEGKSKEISSKKRNLRDAKKVLFEWYHSLQYKQSNAISVHDQLFNKLFKQYIKYRRANKDGAYTDNIDTQFNAFYKEVFANRKINSISKKTIIEYLRKRRSLYKKKTGKEISHFTLSGDLMMLSGFMTWCTENGHKNTPLRISTKWVREVTTVADRTTARTFFTISEYDKLLSTSRARIKKAKEQGNPLWVARRELLHNYIIFMCGSGLRTGEAKNLKWNDVKWEGHNKRSNEKNLELNVSGKRGGRTVITKFTSYFALEKLYNNQKGNEYIFNVGMRRGLNDLLNAAKLKTQKFGNKILKRDAKSFRSTYISWELIGGKSHFAISKNCGVDISVIQNFYARYIKIQEFKKDLIKINSVKLHK